MAHDCKRALQGSKRALQGSKRAFQGSKRALQGSKRFHFAVLPSVAQIRFATSPSSNEQNTPSFTLSMSHYEA